jgi:transketolase
MRNAFIDELVLQASTNERIVLIVGDLGYSVVEPFADRFPNRFINAGVAEQNMMGLAAGMASEGYQVFVYSIANFPTFRCAEQIRNDVAYHNLPVTVVAVGGGLGYGNLGYSHHAIQDYGLMRMMPNILIAAPGDPMEVKGCLRYLIDNPQPSYLRLGKAGERSIHKSIPSVSPGEWLKISGNLNSNRAILTPGCALELANNSLMVERGDVALFSLPLWGMHFKKNQHSQMARLKELITIEDHLEDCGFGSWILESLMNISGDVPKITTRSLNSDICGFVGTQKILNEMGGLTVDCVEF